MKYRKKPVEVEALKFTGNNFKELKEFAGNNVYDLATVGSNCYCKVKTLEGIMIATEGDYIIKGVKGEFYPCKPDIFEKTYEVVE